MRLFARDVMPELKTLGPAVVSGATASPAPSDFAVGVLGS